MKDRIPPHSIEAEAAVLGALMLGDWTTDQATFDRLTPEDFYRPAHAQIYETCRALHNQLQPLDTVTLRNELARRGILDEVGGVAYLMQLSDDVPTAASLPHYTQIVRNHARSRRLIEFAGEVAAAAYAAQSPDDVIASAENTLFALRDASGGAEKEFVPWSTLANDVLAEAERAALAGGDFAPDSTILTGYVAIDRLTGGMRRQEQIILCAPPGVGKTTLATNIAGNVARGGQRVAIVSLEMRDRTQMRRILAAETAVPANTFKHGRFNEVERENIATQMEWIARSEAAILDQRSLSVAGIRAQLRRFTRRGPVDLVIVDYLTLVQGDRGRRDGNRSVEVAEISRGLRALWQEFDCAGIVISQLSRAYGDRQDKRPVLTDLRESGAVEQDADQVWALYRPSYFDTVERRSVIDPMDLDETEFIALKNRDEAPGMVRIGFRGGYLRYEGLESQPEDNWEGIL